MKMSTEPGFSWVPPAEMKRRIDTIPLPKKVKSTFTTVIHRWQSDSGSEWTVARLKSFRDFLLNSYAIGGFSKTHKPEWFRTTRAGNLSGVFGDLTVIALEGAAQLRAVLNLVNIYTGVHRTNTDDDLIEEIVSSIERPRVKIPKRSHNVVRPGHNMVFRAMKKLGWHKKLLVRQKPWPITWQLPGKESHVKRVPLDINMMSNLPPLNEGVTQLLREATGSSKVMGGNLYTLAECGDIHMTHEPGLKTRYFAAPNLVLQQALTPLKDELLRFLQGVPWDCTLEQRKADKVISTALADGQTVYSVDLSKATDAFPWEWQVAVLDSLLRGREARRALDLFRVIVEQCAWNMPDGSQVMFKAGQPLGLGPSFPTFTLSHGVLLYILNGYNWNQDFFVLGDDVIIFNDGLHSRYREVLRNWSVEVSDSKSFASCNIAQFAGVTYTPSGSFWIPKWRPFSRDNLLDLAAWWYPGLTKGLPDHSLIERVLALPQPYGLGRNPKGIPMDQRFSEELVWELLDREDRRALKAMPSSTRPDNVHLFRAFRKEGWQESTALHFNYEVLDNIPLAKEVVWFNMRHAPTGAFLHPFQHLYHRTEVGGYPRIRYKYTENKVDPYSLGNLDTWKQVFERIDSVQNHAETNR
jgi:hypothetical protein